MLVVVDGAAGAVVVDKLVDGNAEDVEWLLPRVVDALVEFWAKIVLGKATRAITTTASEYLILGIEFRILNEEPLNKC